jgi:hypothetical protein
MCGRVSSYNLKRGFQPYYCGLTTYPSLYIPRHYFSFSEYHIKELTASTSFLKFRGSRFQQCISKLDVRWLCYVDSCSTSRLHKHRTPSCRQSSASTYFPPRNYVRKPVSRQNVFASLVAVIQTSSAMLFGVYKQA